MRSAIASPRPLPRVVPLEEPRLKGWKTSATSAEGIPGPVSRIRNASELASRSSRTTTKPRLVYLTAFPKRFRRIWRTRLGSRTAQASDSISTLILRPFASALPSRLATTSSIKAAGFVGSSEIMSSPASTFAMSRTLSTRESRTRALIAIRS